MNRPGDQGVVLGLIVRDVHMTFASPEGDVHILRGVSLDLSPGGSLAVVGPSGAGKSTLLNIIGSLEAPTAGSVTLGGAEVTSLKGEDLAEYRCRRVGFVFQDHHLLPQCTALENVLLPTLARAADREGASDRAAQLLDQVGLAERKHAYPARLSGGERQRVAIARALVNTPDLLLCDEPTGNLDQRTAQNVASLLLDLVHETDRMVVMATHNMEIAARLGRQVVLRDGVLGPSGEDEP